MKTAQVSTCGWSHEVAGANLDFAIEGSATRIEVEITKPGVSLDPEAVKLQIFLEGNPGAPAREEVHFDLRAQDFRPLLSVLERAIVEGEGAGTLPSVTRIKSAVRQIARRSREAR